jgi:hypothetical protein
VFSGGKLEYRKAQDIVLAAFRIFVNRHKEALLVTAWHCPWQGLAGALDASGLVSPVQFDDEGNVDVVGWAESSVDEVVENLKLVFANRSDARHSGRLAPETMAKLTWKQTAKQLKSLILNRRPHPADTRQPPVPDITIRDAALRNNLA